MTELPPQTDDCKMTTSAVTSLLMDCFFIHTGHPSKLSWGRPLIDNRMHYLGFWRLKFVISALVESVSGDNPELTVGACWVCVLMRWKGHPSSPHPLSKRRTLSTQPEHLQHHLLTPTPLGFSFNLRMGDVEAIQICRPKTTLCTQP